LICLSVFSNKLFVLHKPERKEKNCLSCGTQVQGRFCHVCGQENIVTKQSFWALARHFVYDIFHFDGKFFDTLKHLLFYPGRVPKEYIAGKRVHFLDPIRMYLFTSAVFFLILFSFQNVRVAGNVNEAMGLSKLKRLEVASDLNSQLKNGRNDNLYKMAIDALLDTTLLVRMEKQKASTDSSISFYGEPYRLYWENDSTAILYERSLAKQGWFKRQVLNKVIGKNRKYDDPNEAAQHFLENVVHRIPTLLFFSLPLFALILKLLYKRKKDLYYSDHIVFTLYHYIFSFLLLLAVLAVSALAQWLKWDILKLVTLILLLSWPVYLYKGMRTFYEQSHGKIIVKFIVLNLLGFLALVVLLLIFILITTLFS
jgi:hypothetical protein